MRDFVLQAWTRIGGVATAVSSITQDQRGWIDASGYADAAFWVDVAGVTNTSGGPVYGSVTLNLEGSPTFDEMSFRAIAQPLVLTAASTPTLLRTMRTPSVPAMSRYVRWRLSAQGTGPWDATIRIRGAAGRTRFFSPTQLSGCALWLRADLGITQDPSLGTVSRWADQSGNGNDATQSNTNNQSAYNLNPINTQQTLNFNPTVGGSEKYYNLTNSLAALTAAHAFVVHRRVSASESIGIRTGFWLLGTGAGTPAMPGTDGNIYDDCASTSSHNCGAPVVPLNVPQVYEVQSKPGSWSNRLNGTAQFSTAANTLGASAAPQIGGNSSWPNYYYGDWAEMILYNRILTTSERATLVAYFNGRYGLGAV